MIMSRWKGRGRGRRTGNGEFLATTLVEVCERGKQRGGGGGGGGGIKEKRDTGEFGPVEVGGGTTYYCGEGGREGG